MLEIENGEINTKGRNCKFCNSWIEEARIILSSASNLLLTESLQSAGEVRGFNYALPIIIGVVVFEVILSYMVFDDFHFLAHLMLIFTSLYFFSGFNLSNKWLKKYKGIRIYDNELMSAKKNIVLSRNIWGAGLLVNIVIWLSFFSYIKNK